MLPCTRKRMDGGEIGPARNRDPHGLDRRFVVTQDNRGLIRTINGKRFSTA